MIAAAATPHPSKLNSTSLTENRVKPTNKIEREIKVGKGVLIFLKKNL